MFQPDEKLLNEHYAEHVGKPFFKPLVGFMSSGPVFAFVREILLLNDPKCTYIHN